MNRIAAVLAATVAVAGGVIALRAQSARRSSSAPMYMASGASPAPSAKQIRGASPYVELKNEPEPKLFVDPPLPNLLDQGVVWIQWRAENVHIVPVFGKGAVNVSPRAGHLHVQVDDQPWWWADASDNNTIDLAGLPAGPHRVKLTLVNPNHEPFPGQSRTIAFNVKNGPKH